MPSLFRGLYSLVWQAARPVLRRHKRLADGFDRRLVPPDWAGPADVWVQSASGGESYLSRQLAQALAADGGGPLGYLATTCTRQGMDILQGTEGDPLVRQGICFARDFLPLDQPEIMDRAMTLASPRLLVLLETELWPGLLMAAKKAAVPVLLCNGRMTAKSFSGYRRSSLLWRSLAPDRILAVSDSDAARFAALYGKGRVATMSNMKFDALAAEQGAAAPGWRTLSDAPLFLLGSVRREEEDMLLPVVGDLVRRNPGAAVIVAPRHMQRTSAWLERLSALKIPAHLRSQGGDAFPKTGAVTVWDCFGELRGLYAAADAVFVGGTLAPLGGQNFLEPMPFGLVPCVGPYRDNFAWADGLEDAGLIHPLASAGEIPAAFKSELGRDRDKARAAFSHWVRPRLGGSAQAAAQVRAMLALP